MSGGHGTLAGRTGVMKTPDRRGPGALPGQDIGPAPAMVGQSDRDVDRDESGAA